MNKKSGIIIGCMIASSVVMLLGQSILKNDIVKFIGLGLFVVFAIVFFLEYLTTKAGLYVMSSGILSGLFFASPNNNSATNPKKCSNIITTLSELYHN